MPSVQQAVIWPLFRVWRPAATPSPRHGRLCWWLGLGFLAATGLLLGWSFADAAGRTSWTTAFLDLTQFHTNDAAPESWGSHWRFHLGSGVAFCAAGALVSILFARAAAPAHEASAGPRSAALRAAGLFLAATVISLPRLDFLMDPRFVGHQFREATGIDLPVAVPLLMAALLFWDRWSREGRTLAPMPAKSLVRPMILATLLAGLPVVVLGARLLSVNVAAQMARLPGAVHWSPPDLYAWHVFEHTLDYAFLALAGSAAVLLSAGRRNVEAGP